MQPKDTFLPSPRRLAVLRHGARTDAQTLIENPFVWDEVPGPLWLGTRVESCCPGPRRIEISRADQLPAAKSNGSSRTEL